MIELNSLNFGCCLKLMELIPDRSIDLIPCDLPYGSTRNKWDIIIPPALLWAHYNRIIKPNGAIILFGQGIFTAKMILSNESMYRYSLIWEKSSPKGFLNANKMPLRSHEDMMVFYNSPPTYNPQKTTGHERKVSTAHHKRDSKKTTNYGEHGLTGYDSTERFPRSVWKFASDTQKSALHPTQKPVALISELIKTYSNEGDTVLDNCAGSGTTGVSCIETGRNFILMENDPESFAKAKNRLGL